MVIGKGFQGLDLEEEGLSSVFTSQTLLVQVATPRRLNSLEPPHPSLAGVSFDAAWQSDW